MKTPEFDKEVFAVLIVQTGDTSASTGDIVEVAVFLNNPNKAGAASGYSEFVHTGKPITYFMGERLGITPEMMASARSVEPVLADLFAYIGKANIYTYDNNVTEKLIRYKLSAVDVKPENRFYSIADIVHEKIEGLTSYSLKHVTQALGIKSRNKGIRAAEQAEMAFALLHLLAVKSKDELAHTLYKVTEEYFFEVYALCDTNGNPFYVGVQENGCDEIPKNRFWDRYVNGHLKGKFNKKIINKFATSKEAANLKEKLMLEFSDALINIVNFNRPTNFSEQERLNNLRKKNKELYEHALNISELDSDAAIDELYSVIKRSDDYLFSHGEGGVIGKLITEEINEVGVVGEVDALDKLTLLLVKRGRLKEARDFSEKFFEKYKKSIELKKSAPIRRRVGLVG